MSILFECKTDDGSINSTQTNTQSAGLPQSQYAKGLAAHGSHGQDIHAEISELVHNILIVDPQKL